MSTVISPLERSFLVCRERDAQELRAAIRAAWRFCTAEHDPSVDALEAAKLACQTRDAATLRQAVATVSNGARRPTASNAGQAHA